MSESESPSLGTLQVWLRNLVGEGEEVSSWEASPETLRVLSTLYKVNTRMEQHTEQEVEKLELQRAEYEAEEERLNNILSRVGVGEEFRQGRAQVRITSSS